MCDSQIGTKLRVTAQPLPIQPRRVVKKRKRKKDAEKKQRGHGKGKTGKKLMM